MSTKDVLFCTPSTGNATLVRHYKTPTTVTDQNLVKFQTLQFVIRPEIGLPNLRCVLILQCTIKLHFQ